MGNKNKIDAFEFFKTSEEDENNSNLYDENSETEFNEEDKIKENNNKNKNNNSFIEKNLSDVEISDDDNEDNNKNDISNEKKNKKLTVSVKEIEKTKEKIKKSGVVYLSRIPPYMKPAKMRQILSKFGELDRIYLVPEDIKSYKLRVKSGGNRKHKFIEGWVEFVNKKEAKLAAETLNNNIIGGKKGSYYHDDILNIKYLPKFKWHHLTEQKAYQNRAQQAKLEAEISQANKINKAFIRNVEKAKMLEKIRNKKDYVDKTNNEYKDTIRKNKDFSNFDKKKINDKNKKETNKKSSNLDSVLESVF